MCGKADGAVICGGAFGADELPADEPPPDEPLDAAPEGDESPAPPVATGLAGFGASGPGDFNRPMARITNKAMMAAASRWRCGICFNRAMCRLIRSFIAALP